MVNISLKKILKEILQAINGLQTKSAISACGTTTTEISLTTSSKMIPMTSSHGTKGSDLTLTSEGGVQCNKAGVVAVSACGYFTSGFNNGDRIHLVINESHALALVNQCACYYGTYNYIATAPIIRHVTPGTTYNLYAYNQNGNRGYISNNTPTYLTVMYL